MKATDVLLAIYDDAVHRERELYEKWISISHKIGAIAGEASSIAFQRNGRLDLMLRLLESERLDRMRIGLIEEPIHSLDLQVALSENWIMSAYEVARAAKKPFKTSGENSDRLFALEYRLALVRMPIAKGVIKGMDFSKNATHPPLMIRLGDDVSELYQNDGTYIMPMNLCEETGAIVWLPVDMKTRKMVAICRRDLSNELLAIFD